MSDTPESDTGESTRKERRRASRAAGPAGGDGHSVIEVTAPAEGSVSVPSVRTPVAPPPRRRANSGRVAVTAGVIGALLLGGLGWGVWELNSQRRVAEAQTARAQRFVDTASQTVVNMFSYNQQNIDKSVNRFVDGTSGPLRDMLNQNNNVENLKLMFRDTNATSEAVVSGAALEKIDETSDNGSVLVAVRVTVTDVDGVNKPSQAYRLRVIVHEDDNGRMTGYDLKYPDGGN